MRVCPRCDFHDDPHWRPRIWDPGVDVVSIEDLETFNAELSCRLKQIRWGRATSVLFDGIYVYMVTKTGMVWRLEQDLWKAFGKKFHVRTDGTGTPKSAAYKKAVSRISRVAREGPRDMELTKWL